MKTPVYKTHTRMMIQIKERILKIE